MYHTDDTICAIASAPAGAARGIVRLSGPGTIAVLERCFRCADTTSLEQVRVASVLVGTVAMGLSVDIP